MDYAISRRIILYPDGLFYVQTVCAYIYGLYPDGLFYFPEDYPIFLTDYSMSKQIVHIFMDSTMSRRIILYSDRLSYIMTDYAISRRIIQYRNSGLSNIATDHTISQRIIL